MDLSFLVDVVSSAGFGSVVGGLFGLLNRREERKNIESQNQFELQRIDANTRSQSILADKQIEDKEAAAFVESQRSMSAFGSAIKSAVRPLITAALLYITYDIYSSLKDITGGIEAFPPQDAINLYRSLVMNIIALTATAVSWWFASRSSNQENSWKRTK